ncbi:uncharacterized protein SPAPADRAFT_50076 [Spathaspora passalidarum NRRL Y-27907]|uniref:Uncharacterized protein n=1 Tax=Spathaspora passalidarum (strain NRRL Y-27907 / 11-Y1) TaxID=619300 RepID=G3ALC0_SPAPN|nr:uncharacterized protein SPAPADRAFT_50076 [Spathaspora passalidarum NRRL Y-27907]EGW33163.1 hypothetical protein SPAPADRAFT_50076 [Spathaspora passalidarum NRRL Y-27907]
MKLARGVAKLSLSSIQASLQSSDNDEREIIKHIDYDMLERAYNIHKYYPQYIHNYDISTPVLRMLIVDKPIYNDANQHLKNGESYEKRKLLNCQLHEKRDARKASRKERKERKREKQLMKQEQKLKNKGYHDQFKNEDSDYYSDSTDVDIDEQIITGKAELVSIPLVKDSTTWSESSNTRAESTRTMSKNKLITKSHTHPTSKHNSFGFKILNKMFPKSPPGTKNSADAPMSKMISLQPIDKSSKSEIIIPLQKANTFEQTKSNLTLSRRLAKRLTRSDQENPNVIGMYTFFYFILCSSED